MRKIIVVLCLSIVVFSCKTTITVAQKPQPHTKPVVKKPQPVVIETEQEVVVEVPPKVYASKTDEYIDTHRATAQEEMVLYGIPASITLAQGILESGNGSGRLAVEANNHFGIKCHGWTGDKIYHDDDASQECFRKYKDAKYSFRDHSLFLSERSRYANLFKLDKKDYEGWAKGLKAAGYATDPKYPAKLISLIERYQLYQFDEAVLGENYKKYEPEMVEDRGNTYTVSKGDTLYAISKRYNITVEQLQKLNGLKSNALDIGQVLVVKP